MRFCSGFCSPCLGVFRLKNICFEIVCLLILLSIAKASHGLVFYRFESFTIFNDLSNGCFIKKNDLFHGSEGIVWHSLILLLINSLLFGHDYSFSSFVVVWKFGLCIVLIVKIFNIYILVPFGTHC